ncbi:MAG: beta-ketoacyl-[acyl-carrier-protein] synthase family protein [Spirochaetia bacterium]|nr:beta-ketoacyl-[acyl-carrier-protein] synthase family protein [Spirochaetia bacterium]
MRRVVVTGLGVIAPNGHGLEEFENALRKSVSGIRFIDKLAELKFGCQVGGIPESVENKLPNYFTEEELLAMNEGMIYTGIAGIDAWKDAGLNVPEKNGDVVNWDAGCAVGVGLGGMDTISEKLIPKIAAGKVRRMGSTMVEQCMTSAITAKLSGLLALGNQVTTNSSACNTGTEAIVDSYNRIKFGLADKMLAGGAEGSSPYTWGGFDGMKVLCSDFNDTPQEASRPMSESAGGFIPGSGCGILLLESLESAEKRGARIYAEIIGSSLNCGGHRMGGSMTAPNPTSVQNCIKNAMNEAGITGDQVDAINGHLTATMADPIEVDNWSKGLNRSADNFPYINSTKSLIGHCLGAAGSIESVASVLQLHKGFVHKSLNCEDLHEKIQPYAKSVVQETKDVDIKILAKASFGFGDVNGCIIYKKWD